MSKRLSYAAFAASIVMSAAPLQAAVVYVSNASELSAAFGKVRGGDTIALAPGQYDNLTIRNAVYSSAINIVSAVPSRPAVLSSFTMKASRNITISGVELGNMQPSPSSFAASFFDSSNITIRNTSIHGVTGAPLVNQSRGLRITGSNRVTVLDNTISHLSSGMLVENSTGVTISRNQFTGLRHDGLNVAGTQSMTITNNSFSNFQPSPADHPDAIQFWASAAMTTRDVMVRNNLVLSAPGAQVQGVFMQSGSPQAGAKFQNITVQGNLMYGTMWNGIAMFGAESMKIAQNTIFALQDTQFRNSWIRLVDVDYANVSRNSASTYMLDVDRLVAAGNVSNSLTKEAVLAMVALWQASNRVGANLPGLSTLADLSDTAFGSLSMKMAAGDGIAAASLAAAAVPEPAIWLQMVLGFAAVGLGIRTARRPRISRPS